MEKYPCLVQCPNMGFQGHSFNSVHYYVLFLLDKAKKQLQYSRMTCEERAWTHISLEFPMPVKLLSAVAISDGTAYRGESRAQRWLMVASCCPQEVPNMGPSRRQPTSGLCALSQLQTPQPEVGTLAYVGFLPLFPRPGLCRCSTAFVCLFCGTLPHCSKFD